jgi:hypothetical protein
MSEIKIEVRRGGSDGLGNKDKNRNLDVIDLEGLLAQSVSLSPCLRALAYSDDSGSSLPLGCSIDRTRFGPTTSMEHTQK